MTRNLLTLLIVGFGLLIVAGRFCPPFRDGEYTGRSQ